MTYKKRKRCIYLITILLMFTSMSSISTSAEGGFQKAQPNIVVIFSSEKKAFDEHQRMLDMLLGHFTDDITFKASSHVNKQDIDQADYVFYYGQQRETLPESLIDILSSYEGTFISIGYNAYQFEERYAFVEWLSNDTVINRVLLTNTLTKEHSFTPASILNINLVDADKTETLLTGHMEKEAYPLFVKNQKTYYFAAPKLDSPFSIIFAEALYDVFEETPRADSNKHPGYIRLEDVHPLADPGQLMGIAEILADKNIPYMIAVIPVYTNPETQEQHHFSDSPELIKTLKFMQENGGSIVLHGYTHQYRLSETGEGFEFWDTEHNRPIYQGQDETVTIKTQDDFNTELGYQQYLDEQKAYERQYIEDRLIKGIEELANYGLFPLAFEAPHYTMSQQGYEVTSEYFSTYVGQLQLSDKNWKAMDAAPYITTPSFLHGMQLLPETIGYVDPEDPQAIEKMIERAKGQQFVRNGMIAGFYHPYLGVELFQEFIEAMDEIPHVNWIDLQHMPSSVQTGHVSIQSEDGELLVDINRIGLLMSSWQNFSFHLSAFITMALWGFAGIGGLAVLIFIYLTIVNQKRHTTRSESVG